VQHHLAVLQCFIIVRGRFIRPFAPITTRRETLKVVRVELRATESHDPESSSLSKFGFEACAERDRKDDYFLLEAKRGISLDGEAMISARGRV